MQREITVRELEDTVNSIDNIEEPIIVKRNNKRDLVVLSLEQYQKQIFFNKLEQSKQQFKDGKIHNAREVFSELREKYGY